MFPTNSECLIGISDAFSAFVYVYPSSCPRAQCTLNKSVTTLRYTRRHGPVYRFMPEGSYRVQSPGFPKIVYCSGVRQVHAPNMRLHNKQRSERFPAYFSVPYTLSRQLSSSADTQILCIPHVRPKTCGQRCFSYCVPKQWNSSTSDIRRSQV